MRKTLKMIGIIIISLIGLAVITGVLFLNLSPEFGQTPSKEQKASFAQLDNYSDGKFQNQSPSPMDINTFKVLREFLKNDPSRKPARPIDVQKIDSAKVAENQKPRLTWFGHSAFLLELDGKKILIDPMFGDNPSPHPWLGTSRYSEELPISIHELPHIDAVIISHDHYDHLDYGSIKKLKEKVGQFYMPLGVGNHLKKWGVDESKIHELNWWESVDFEGIELVSCPSRHFSGRGLFDRASTLWCSWVIKGQNQNIYFSGDSGYDNHFKEIGEKYGPFDIALMECGQYNQQWKYIHMMPEESAQGAVDLQARLAMPIHWGAFTLALHDWTDPVERFTAKAKELNLQTTTPRIGEAILLNPGIFPEERWWLNYK